MRHELLSIPKRLRYHPQSLLLLLRFPRHSLEEAYILHKWARAKRKIDLTNPRSFAEKIEWLKLNDCREEYISMVDKIRVREYVREITDNPSLLPRLHGTFFAFDEIDLSRLPDRFVIKTNHWSGNTVVCNKMKTCDWRAVRRKLERCMTTRYGQKKGEWPYWHIKPELMVEEYLEDQFNQLIDYKVFCFGGEPRFIMVCADRFEKSGMHRLFLDTEWHPLPIRDKYPTISGDSFPRPKSLECMLQYARALSADKHFLRVDFYDLFGSCRFGELTFFPESGVGSWFEPVEWNYTIGDWLRLPTKVNRHGRLSSASGKVTG